MQIIQPSVELWTQPSTDEGIVAHIARCARVCYQSCKTDGNELLVQHLLENGHLSMLRHATYYFRLSSKDEPELVRYLLHREYVHSASIKAQHLYFFAINGQTWLELHPDLQAALQRYRTTEQAISEATDDLDKKKVFQLLGIIRTTVICTTQISTSREMNRTSPNNIAEQSTRYVNFGKKGGITICLPHSLTKPSPKGRVYNTLIRCLYYTMWKIDEWAYKLALRLGLKPEDARGFLPLDTATRVVYTYTGTEWRHIMDLRLRDKTGRAHPNAKILAEQIQQAVNMKMKILNREYSI